MADRPTYFPSCHTVTIVLDATLHIFSPVKIANTHLSIAMYDSQQLLQEIAGHV
jgi:hypothetical protein